MIRRVAAVAALGGAVVLSLWGSTRPLSHLFIKLAPDAPQSEFFTTGWSTTFAGTVDEHSPLFGVPIAVAALVLVVALAWPKKAKPVAFAGSAMLLGVTGMLLVYLTDAIEFHRQGNLAIDPALEAGFGTGILYLVAATVLAFAGTVLHPSGARRASPVPRAP